MTLHIFTNKHEQVILARTEYDDTVAEARRIAQEVQDSDLNLHHVGTEDEIGDGEGMVL